MKVQYALGYCRKNRTAAGHYSSVQSNILNLPMWVAWEAGTSNFV